MATVAAQENTVLHAAANLLCEVVVLREAELKNLQIRKKEEAASVGMLTKINENQAIICISYMLLTLNCQKEKQSLDTSVNTVL